MPLTIVTMAMIPTAKCIAASGLPCAMTTPVRLLRSRLFSGGVGLQVFVSAFAIQRDMVDYNVARSGEGSGGYGNVFHCIYMKMGFPFAFEVVSIKSHNEMQVSAGAVWCIRVASQGREASKEKYP